MPPNNQPQVHWVEQAQASISVGVETLLVSKLNALLSQPQDQCKEDLTTDIVNYGLVDHTLHFIPRWRYRGKGGWSLRMWRDGRPIAGRGGYIIGTGRRYFYNACIRESRVSTDHRMILYELKGGR